MWCACCVQHKMCMFKLYYWRLVLLLRLCNTYWCITGLSYRDVKHSLLYAKLWNLYLSWVLPKIMYCGAPLATHYNRQLLKEYCHFGSGCALGNRHTYLINNKLITTVFTIRYSSKITLFPAQDKTYFAFATDVANSNCD